jgi:hypothetical protein
MDSGAAAQVASELWQIASQYSQLDVFSSSIQFTANIIGLIHFPLIKVQATITR